SLFRSSPTLQRAATRERWWRACTRRGGNPWCCRRRSGASPTFATAISSSSKTSLEVTDDCLCLLACSSCRVQFEGLRRCAAGFPGGSDERATFGARILRDFPDFRSAVAEGPARL